MGFEVASVHSIALRSLTAPTYFVVAVAHPASSANACSITVRMASPTPWLMTSLVSRGSRSWVSLRAAVPPLVSANLADVVVARWMVRRERGQAPCLERACVGVRLDGEQDPPSPYVLVAVGRDGRVPAMTGEVAVGGAEELFALALVLADEQHV